MKLFAWFAFAILVASISGCELTAVGNQKAGSITQDTAGTFLKKHSFYADKETYREAFYSHYNAAIQSKDYNKAKSFIAAYGCVTDGIYDSVYLSVADEFVSKNYPVSIDSQYAIDRYSS